MRVVAGTYKGHSLKTLKGEATRPTTMRVKESLFSSLTSLLGSFENLNVLDGFAGCGALGIEALSRGAAHVVFFEKSRQAAHIVKDNLNRLPRASERSSLEIGDTFRLACRTRPFVFDLVFLDPPYAFTAEHVLSLIELLDNNAALSADALICYELAKKNKVACCNEAHRLKWEVVSSKDFGETTYIILRKGI